MKIKQDIHIHTYLSPCAQSNATPQFYIDNAADRGLELIGFADHMWDNGRGFSIASYERHQTHSARLLRIKDDLAKCTVPDGLRVLVGCETDFVADSTLGISREVAAQLDFVLVPISHTHFPEVCPSPYRDDLISCGRFALDAFKRLMKHPDADLITAVPHPMATHYVGQEGSDSAAIAAMTNAEFREAFLPAADKGIGIEINATVVMLACRAAGVDVNDLDKIKNLEYYRMFSIAKEVGCKFTFGSDAHSQGAVQEFCYAQAVADALGLTEDDVILL